MAKQGTQCCAFGCKKRKKRKTEAEVCRSDSEGSEDEESAAKRRSFRTFHSFPSDPVRRLTWVSTLHRQDWSPSIHSRICSDHFLERDIIRTGQKVVLRGDAVPSRFKNFPKHLKEACKKRKPLHDRKSAVNSTVNNDCSLDQRELAVSSQDKKEVSDHLMKLDHNYCISESPRKLKRKLIKSLDRLDQMKKKLKASREKSRRMKIRVKSLRSVIKELRKRHLISSNCEEMLRQSYSGVTIELIKRITSGKQKGSKYPPELKSFALTLQFYSTKAYNFVRKSFALALPHPAQIRKWYGKIPAEPGFTQPAFTTIRSKVEAEQACGRSVVLSLMLDEMSIRKHVAWDGTKFRGYVDLGNGSEPDDSTPVAKDALVLMAVCINSSWKVPCGYFFLDGLSGSERANLVKVCIERLADTGALVVSLICDGPSCHLTMLSELGASLDPRNMQPSFPHPLNPCKRIHVYLDVCHMLKLLRNTLAQGGILKDCDGNKILWQYVKDLQKLQDEEGLRLGNKLKKAHINWHQQKMKVNLAAQTFSSSVADALEYCSTHLKLQQFKGCEATIRFIRVFDHLFDILNSRNPVAKGYKSALRLGNRGQWQPFLDEAFRYISQLKDAKGHLMYNTRRKTGFIGFLVAIKSTKALFHELVEQAGAPLKYLLLYKFSQDHLELFFGAIRSAGGFNNNPTAQQFTAAYKRLLLRSHIKGGKGNCKQQDATDILIGDTCQIDEDDHTITTAAMIRKYDLTERKPLVTEHDYTDIPNVLGLSEFKTAAISYIAGYVAMMALKKTFCHKCCKALGSSNAAASSTFLKLKDRGGLFKPTTSVLKVCEQTEKCFLRMLTASGGHLPQCKGIPDAIATAVLQDLNMGMIFTDLDSHMVECAVDDNHTFGLVKH